MSSYNFGKQALTTQLTMPETVEDPFPMQCVILPRGFLFNNLDGTQSEYIHSEERMPNTLVPAYGVEMLIRNNKPFQFKVQHTYYNEENAIVVKHACYDISWPALTFSALDQSNLVNSLMEDLIKSYKDRMGDKLIDMAIQEIQHGKK